jgi:hypothetical protein
LTCEPTICTRCENRCLRQCQQQARAIEGFDLERGEGAVFALDEAHDRLLGGRRQRGARRRIDALAVQLAFEQANQRLAQLQRFFVREGQPRFAATLVANPEDVDGFVVLAGDTPRVGFSLDHVQVAQHERRADRGQEARPIVGYDADGRAGTRFEKNDPMLAGADSRSRAIRACAAIALASKLRDSFGQGRCERTQEILRKGERSSLGFSVRRE